MITYEEYKNMARYAHDLCKNRIPKNQYDIANRNNEIIKDLMAKYNLSTDIATEIFNNNNDSAGLKEAYEKRFKSV